MGPIRPFPGHGVVGGPGRDRRQATCWHSRTQLGGNNRHGPGRASRGRFGNRRSSGRRYHGDMVDPPQRSGALLVDRSARPKLAITGAQALWFCDQLLTNKLVDLAPGEGAEALLLTPHGRIVAALRLAHPAEGEVIADLEPPASRAAELVAFFEGRIFATRAAVRDVSEELGLITLIGPAADEIAAAGLDVTPEMLPGLQEHASTRVGDVVAVRVARPGAGLDLLVPRGQLAALTGELEG